MAPKRSNIGNGKGQPLGLPRVSITLARRGSRMKPTWFQRKKKQPVREIIYKITTKNTHILSTSRFCWRANGGFFLHWRDRSKHQPEVRILFSGSHPSASKKERTWEVSKDLPCHQLAIGTPLLNLFHSPFNRHGHVVSKEYWGIN